MKAEPVPIESNPIIASVERLTQIGAVHGNVIIKLADDSKLIERLLKQERDTQLKSWRPLALFRFTPFPCMFEKNEEQTFAFYLACALRTALASRNYLRFTALFRKLQVSEYSKADNAYDVYCGRPDFIGAAGSERRTLLDIHREEIAAAIVADDKATLFEIEASKVRRDKRILEDNWNLHWEMELSEVWSGATVTYDAHEKKISFISLTTPDPVLEKPVELLQHTSGMLGFVAAAKRKMFPSIAEFESRAATPAKVRLVLDLLERGDVDLAQIRINAEDFEEWDYLGAGSNKR